MSGPVNWLVYKDTENKFSIKYPDNWEPKEVATAIAFLSPLDGTKDKFRENVNVMVQDLKTHPMDLSEFTELTRKQIKLHAGNDAILGEKRLTFAGQPAEQFIYKATIQEVDLKFKQYWFIKGTNAFVLTYTAEPQQYERYEDVGTEMLDSFKLDE